MSQTSAYNFTDIIEHKERIIIPFFDLEVRGRLFLFVSLLASLLVGGTTLLITIKFAKSLVFLALSNSILSFAGILSLVQARNSDSDSYKFQDLIRQFKNRNNNHIFKHKSQKTFFIKTRGKNDFVDYY